MLMGCWVRAIFKRSAAFEQCKEHCRMFSSSLRPRPRITRARKNWLRAAYADNIRRETIEQPVEPNLIFRERFRKEMDTVKLAPQIFDYFLVLDFEATCDRTRMPEVQEIIEFPVVKVDAQTMEVVSTFHHYVLPRVNPALTTFCTQLTGIIQDMVDGQPHFEEVTQLFQKWMDAEGLLHPECKSCFVTCGDWDLATMLPMQSDYFKVPVPSYFDRWINVKHSFSECIGHFPRGLMLMLESLNIQHTGRHHSGIDDCMNIVKIMRALSERGYVFRINGQRTAVRGGKGKKF
ncbi:ERI1 exoribonuclease 3-like [Paramacrobiotus metropolitanus]|uniref:ERI1 exoribonuclease 3-like n=1 Tax=Paramacrobiotus metropolitanus TaxID=2943436 RepID=UPI0024465D08|nr:ERI1 exoribonuclease 3-like [Paramacrobiotus metropolitanus]XP_055328043.1 ERI1 exoribonuclease 3-like [Paramacrobiotus metropolitanus]